MLISSHQMDASLFFFCFFWLIHRLGLMVSNNVDNVFILLRLFWFFFSSFFILLVVFLLYERGRGGGDMYGVFIYGVCSFS